MACGGLGMLLKVSAKSASGGAGRPEKASSGEGYFYVQINMVAMRDDGA